MVYTAVVEQGKRKSTLDTEDMISAIEIVRLSAEDEDTDTAYVLDADGRCVWGIERRVAK